MGKHFQSSCRRNEVVIRRGQVCCQWRTVTNHNSLVQRSTRDEESGILSVVKKMHILCYYIHKQINTINIMFHAPMGRFLLELIYYFTYFSTFVPSNICVFLSCRPFVLNTTFSTGLVGVEVTSVSWLGQLTVGVQHI